MQLVELSSLGAPMASIPDVYTAVSVPAADQLLAGRADDLRLGNAPWLSQLAQQTARLQDCAAAPPRSSCAADSSDISTLQFSFRRSSVSDMCLGQLTQELSSYMAV